MEGAPTGKAFQALAVVEYYLHPHRRVGRWKHTSMSQPVGQAKVRTVTLFSYCQQDTCFRRTSGIPTTETSHGQSRTQRCCPEKRTH
jgi:peptidase E